MSSELEPNEASYDPQNEDTYKKMRVSQFTVPKTQFQVMQDPQDIMESQQIYYRENRSSLKIPNVQNVNLIGLDQDDNNENGDNFLDANEFLDAHGELQKSQGAPDVLPIQESSQLVDELEKYLQSNK